MFLFAKKTWLVAVAAGALTLSACSPKEDQAAATEPNAGAEAAVYKVAVDAAYAPFEYQDDKGQVIGFSKDVLQAVADKAGIKVDFIPNPWEGIFATLEQGDRDIVLASVTITPERQQTMTFSEPYFEATQMIAVSDKAGDVTGLNDLKDKTVSVQNGTTGDLVMQKLQGKTSTMIKRFESMPLALKELLAGGVVASVGDNGVMQNFINNNPNANLKVIVDADFEKEHYGFVVKKGRQDLADKINEGLKGIREDGTYDQIYAQWFSAK